MSSIKPSYLLVVMAMFVFAGCGDRNDKAVYAPEGGHISGWTVNHKTSAKADLETCVECHGDSLDGGVAKVSCSLCHLGGAGAVHPTQWGTYAYARHKSYSTAQKTITCANGSCHGAALAGGTSTAPSCATACHLGGIYKKHPADWTAISSHKAYLNANANNSTTCKTSICHGLTGLGVFLSGPACNQCHSMK